MYLTKTFYVKLLKFVLFVATIVNVYVFLTNSSINRKNFSYVKPYASEIASAENKQIDWHDYKFMLMETLRSGPGENGLAVKLTDPIEIKANAKGFAQEGFYTVVSDKISPNRSLPDVRLEV